MATFKVPFPAPSPVEDAELLRKAFQGWGTDEKIVIAILAHRDAKQRLQIQEAYQDLYNEDLATKLQSELSGEFERAMYLWIFNPVDREAMIANAAMKKGLDYRVIVEVACISSTNELLKVKQAYQALFMHSLEEDLASKTSGNLRQLLVGLVSTYRFDGKEVDTELASVEADALHDAIKNKASGYDEAIRILTTRSKAQLNATFNKYKDEHGTSISQENPSSFAQLPSFPHQDLATGLPDPFFSAMRIAVRCTVSHQKYLEKLLRRSLNEAEEDVDDNLCRVIVTRAEKDLQEIKDMYEKRATNETLAHALERKASGHHRSFLLALVGN
ncbi:hypothetical protein HPP92_010998 [Vanilla planifolia]|uniref:Annexin n=1 Tax=Vanilla planifolia TaxID=51239 RepID=A0A835R203_VANPL|nr:hypothetical protein HPP92_010998 [Vanilla planifolia]